MNTNTLINLGCTGDRKTTTVEIPEQFRSAYRNMMSIFLKQDYNIEKAYIQVKDNNLSFALHAKIGNVLFVKLNELTKKTRLPIEGDFLLEGTSDPESKSRLRRNIYTPGVHANANEQSDIPISPSGRSGYNHNTRRVNNTTQIYNLELGLTGFAIPLAWSPIKGVHGYFCDIVTSELRSPSSGNQPMTSYLLEHGATTNLPLTSHAYYASGFDVNSLSLIHSIKNESIVKNALPNDYDIANLAFLCEMPRGTIRKAITKIKKSKPFGELNVLYDTTNGKVVVRVLNETSEVQTTSISNNIIYTSPDNISGSSSITYPTWFDAVETRRQVPSVNNFTLTDSTDSLQPQELFGVTKSGAIVYGLKTETATIMTSLSNLETSPAFDKDALDKTAVAVIKKRKTKSVKAPIVLSEEELLTQVMAQAVLRDEPFYVKWKEVSDRYCTDRNEPKVADLQKVFLNYFLQTTGSGGTITDEDRDEFNRLK
tara:strand:+ start:18380 stop:19828 length:1449 start_codon:yes stop_codon:yes gene_type:complete